VSLGLVDSNLHSVLTTCNNKWLFKNLVYFFEEHRNCIIRKQKDISFNKKRRRSQNKFQS